MHLRKLGLTGFKSFADRTEFIFEPGLTGIVGPNGCGKSNVVDAIRWVLGEQRAKSLRGNEMLDVIFGGTSGRKSLGYAEAVITIDNSSRRLPVDYDEVSIARRLYRSGESEYLLNKQPCRLKDIREVIMDTGIGMDAYSVIEQGKVDILLQANGQDRRSIFEEAAGISKYKARKKAAQSKLARVDNDLVRINDILQEVRKQIRSIERQASKARRYKALADKLRAKELDILLHEYHVAEEKLKVLNQSLDASTRQRESLNTHSDELDAELTVKETEAIDLEQKLSQLHTTDSEAQAQISSAEATVSINRERIHELELAETRCREEIRQATTRIAETEKELERQTAEASAADQEIVQQESALNFKQEQARTLSEKLTELTQRVEEQRASIVDTVQQRSSVQNEIARVSSGQKSLENDRNRLETRAQTLRQEIERLAQNQAGLRESLGRLNQSAAGQRETLERDRKELASCNEKRQQLTDQVHDLRMTLKSKESRHELLTDLEARCEGLDAAVKAVIEESRREGTALTGVRGLVAEMFDVNLEYAPAVETILGDYVQAIVVNSQQDAKAAMSFLRDNHKGRAAFLSLENMSKPSGTHADSTQPDCEGAFVARAKDVVRATDDMKSMADALLSDATVVSNMETALRLASVGDSRTRSYVTPTGELARSDGFLFGGNGQEKLGMISRRSELRELETEMSDLSQQLARIEDERSTVAARASQLQEAILACEAQITRDELSIARRSDELNRVDADIEARREEIDVSNSEITDINSTLEEMGQRHQILDAEVDRLTRVENEVKESVATLERERNESVQEKAELDEEITSLKVRLAQRAERRDALKNSVVHLQRSIQEQLSLIERTKKEIENSIERRELTAQTITEKEQELRTLVERRDTLRVQMGTLESERAALREALDTIKTRARELHSQLQKLDEQIQDGRLRVNELDYEIRSLEERARLECEANLAELPVDEQAPDQDWDQAQQEIDELRRKRDAIGPVNLLAIQELEQLQEREEFLSSQYEDISTAKRSLQEAIRKINHTSRKLFQETFEKVRGNFQVLFRKLFGGGKADIFLEPDMDVLEAGVEIVARPPGKEPRSILLLSGGEKVLTAVALLFAVFQAKPSPFCVLDEVDAALDEENIGRFITMLREFLEHSQFIVITHSKRTMSLADALYGVTMQEPGVSRKVSVKFTNANEEGNHIADQTVEDEAVLVH